MRYVVCNVVAICFETSFVFLNLNAVRTFVLPSESSCAFAALQFPRDAVVDVRWQQGHVLQRLPVFVATLPLRLRVDVRIDQGLYRKKGVEKGVGTGKLKSVS